MTDPHDQCGLPVGLPIEVLVDEQWWPGELRQRRKRDGEWVADVQYNRGPGMNYLAVMPYFRLRISPNEPEHR